MAEALVTPEPEYLGPVPLRIEVPTKVSYLALRRMIGTDGVVKAKADKYVIHAVDQEAARWIITTLRMLGCPILNQE